MPGPLDDLRVVDLSSGPAGGLATMVLADFGADVIKVEPPGGDPLRRLAAAPMWLRGKRSVTLDLREAVARERLHALVRGADVVVASYAPGDAGAAAAAGADYATLSALSRGLVYCSITGWGPRGPYAAYPASQAVVAARSGRMQAFSGLPDREGPAYAAVPVGTHATSQAAVHGILAALLVRDRLGRGQLVETSLLQGMLPYDPGGLLRVQLMRSSPGLVQELPAATMRLPTLNYHPVMTKDGRWIQLGNLLEHLFHAFIAAAELTDLYADERFQGPAAAWDLDAREVARDRILTRMRERTAEEWMEIFGAAGNVAAEPFVTTQDALANPDMVANGDVIELEDPRLGPVRQLGPVAMLVDTPGVPAAPAPAVGEHTDEVLAQPPRVAWSPPAGGGDAAPRHPLEGVTVLDFSTVIATPLGASFLGDLGARVIKVEVIGGDPYRGMGGIGATRVNSSKQSICVDLKTDEGGEILRSLIARADVIVHNYRPGVPERLGMSYEQACAIRPDIVWVSVNGYGPDAPSANRPSTHPVAGAAAGGALHQAGAGMPPAECDSLDELREAARWLMRANEVNPDPNTSMAAASALLIALYARGRSGRGQRAYVNMLAANAYANFDDFVSYEGKPPREEPDAEVYGLHALCRLYPARSGWVFLAVEDDADWGSFCGIAGDADLASDPRFASATARREHDGDLIEALGALFARRDADEWEQALAPAGVGCVRADAGTPGEFWLEDEHALANGLTIDVEHARFGAIKRWGPIVTLDATPGRYGPAPLAGEHTDAILGELGYDEARVTALREAGVVWSEAP